jgi:hypothetical protein
MNGLTAALLLVAAQAAPTDTTGIEVQAVAAPDSVRIGEPLMLTVSVSGVVDGARVVFPQFPDTGEITAYGPPQLFGVEEGDSRSARYELAAWNVGAVTLPVGEVLILAGGAELRIPLPDVTIQVGSVLPQEADADTLAWEPPADVVGSNWSMAEKLAAGGLALALLLAVAFYMRRRSATQPVPLPALKPPRERALEGLDILARSGLIEAGEFKAVYSAISHVLRVFLAETDGRWGLDLTTSELFLEVGQDGIDDSAVTALNTILEEADMVKFAGRRPSRIRVERVLEQARGWLESFVRVEPEPEEMPLEDLLQMTEEESLAAIESIFAEEEEIEANGEETEPPAP